jgi:8-oxo-dGTP pyrophosphatase MutT (NUDIX family)
MELWDAYDKDFNEIKGTTLVRGEPIPDGFFHLVCEVAVRHKDGSYLLMQRDKKKHFAGMWELSAGGSALQDEGPLECAVRELAEETGIVQDSLIEIGKVFYYKHQSIYVEYLCITNCDKSSIKLQEGETSAYKWVSKNELINMSRSELITQRIQNLIEDLSY